MVARDERPCGDGLELGMVFGPAVLFNRDAGFDDNGREHCDANFEPQHPFGVPN